MAWIKDKEEREAFEHHRHYHKVHTFYIHTFEEYLTMKPFMFMCPNRRMVFGRELRNGVFEALLKSYNRAKYKPYQKAYQKKYRLKQVSSKYNYVYR